MKKNILVLLSSLLLFSCQESKEHETNNEIIWLTAIIMLALSTTLVWMYFKIHTRALKKMLLESGNYRLKYLQMEEECNKLNRLLSQQNEQDNAIQEVIASRITLLNKYITAYIKKDNTTYSSKVQQDMEELLGNRNTFIVSNRLAFTGSHPNYIRYLKEKGLDEWEINYCCLYALGLNGKDVGTYIKMPSHYNHSSLIREKLGIDKHNTNLSIYIQKLLNEC